MKIKFCCIEFSLGFKCRPKRYELVIVMLRLVVGSFILGSHSGKTIYQSVCVFACRKLERAVYRLIITNVPLTTPLLTSILPSFVV
jgi:hypothetical protein